MHALLNQDGGLTFLHRTSCLRMPGTHRPSRLSWKVGTRDTAAFGESMLHFFMYVRLPNSPVAHCLEEQVSGVKHLHQRSKDASQGPRQPWKALPVPDCLALIYVLPIKHRSKKGFHLTQDQGQNWKILKSHKPMWHLTYSSSTVDSP